MERGKRGGDKGNLGPGPPPGQANAVGHRGFFCRGRHPPFLLQDFGDRVLQLAVHLLDHAVDIGARKCPGSFTEKTQGDFQQQLWDASGCLPFPPVQKVEKDPGAPARALSPALASPSWAPLARGDELWSTLGLGTADLKADPRSQPPPWIEQSPPTSAPFVYAPGALFQVQILEAKHGQDFLFGSLSEASWGTEGGGGGR